MSYKFPDNLNYADTHEYVLEENGLLKIGVSEFAIDQLGDIVFVELADEGATLEKGETFGTIESVKAVEEVYLPFSGEIVSVNESMVGHKFGEFSPTRIFNSHSAERKTDAKFTGTPSTATTSPGSPPSSARTSRSGNIPSAGQ